MGRLLAPPLAAFLFLGLLLPSLLALVPRAQAAETPAYIALGDSLAFGVGVSDPSTGSYVALTSDVLRKSERYRERGLQLINLSAPGATSGDLLLPDGQLDSAVKEIRDRQQDTSSADDNVEIISIDIGGNDLLSLTSRDSPCFSDSAAEACLQRFGSVLADLHDNLSEALRRLREAAPDAGIFVIDLYNPYSGTGNPLEPIAGLAVQQLNGVIGAVSADAELQVKMADIFQLFQGRGRQWIAADGLHPNEKGYAVMAEVLLAAIQGRQVSIPADLLAETPAPVAPPSDGSVTADSGSGSDGDSLLLLAIAIPVSFAAGLLISVAYFLARGRSG